MVLMFNFSFHNETVNIWTHLIGFVIFVGLLAWDIFLVIPQLREVTHTLDVKLVNLITCYFIIMIKIQKILEVEVKIV